MVSLMDDLGNFIAEILMLISEHPGSSLENMILKFMKYYSSPLSKSNTLSRLLISEYNEPVENAFN